MDFVTTYDDPDLDGVACIHGVDELYSSQGKEIAPIYHGQLGQEISFVRTYTDFFKIEKREKPFNSDDQFVIVDTSDPEDLHPDVYPSRVIRLFDHHRLVYPEKFPISTNIIEPVASCATLITHEFQSAGISPSLPVATYLYSAIVSNSINFKSPITTKDDVDAADWLNRICQLEENYVRHMFQSKSLLNPLNLHQSLEQDFSVKTINQHRIGISQIEITDLRSTFSKLQPEFSQSLHNLKDQQNLDYIFFTGIDLYDGYNLFYTIDPDSRRLFSKALNLNLLEIQETTPLIMRKQIWALVEKELNQVR